MDHLNCQALQRSAGKALIDNQAFSHADVSCVPLAQQKNAILLSNMSLPLAGDGVDGIGGISSDEP